MLGLNKKIITITTALSVAFGYMTDANAIDVTKPLPKLKAAEVLWDNSSHFHKDFDKGVSGDCTSLLSRLDKATKNEKSEYGARVVLGEMYDRSICVNYDPAKAYENFKRAADMGGPYYYAQVGWKHVYGHGVEQSTQKANHAFKLLLIRSAAWKHSQNHERFQGILRDRNIPPLLKQGIDWLIQSTKTDEEAIALAFSLIDGTGKYYDGTSLPVDKTSARYILSQLKQKNPKASYLLGMEHIKGTFGSSNKWEGEGYLMNAAKCGHVPAMIKLAQLAETGDHGMRKSTRDAYGWYLMAEQSGASVTAQLEKAKQNAGSYVQLSIHKDKRYKVDLKSCE